jgi:hypothetical protein
MAGKIQIANLRCCHFRGSAQEGDAGGPQRVAGRIRLSNQQAGAWVVVQVLGVHGHAADEKDRAAEIVSRIGHHGAERESRKLARMSGQAADPGN